MRRGLDEKARAAQLLCELRSGRSQGVDTHTQLRRLIRCRKQGFRLLFAVSVHPQANDPRRSGIGDRQVTDRILRAVRQLQLPAAADKTPQDSVDKAFPAARIFFGHLYRFADRRVFRHAIHKDKLIHAHAQQCQILFF